MSWPLGQTVSTPAHPRQIDAPHTYARPQQLVCHSTRRPRLIYPAPPTLTHRRRYQRSSRRASPPHSSTRPAERCHKHGVVCFDTQPRAPDITRVIHAGSAPRVLRALAQLQARRNSGASKAALRHGDADAFSNGSGAHFCLQPLHGLAQLSGQFQPGLLK